MSTSWFDIFIVNTDTHLVHNMIGFLLSFEIVLDNSGQIFEIVPESKEREANKETKGASDVGDHRDKVVSNDLGMGENKCWYKRFHVLC